jgi:class 3 adenylate cyclase/tetratricopeptide (TPR) repeat protein
VACVLFTDLVGSTELMTGLGDVAFDQLRTEHFSGLRQAISRRGGSEIKNTGDGILATFPSAAEALAAAVAAQQATEAHARRAEVSLQLRVGLALGEVDVDAGDVFGTPVVEAARLVAAARPGQILCTALVRAVAGSRAAVSFGDVGALTLKGLPEPVPAFEVTWEPAPAGTDVPLPALLVGTGRIFVGRDADLARLRQLWKEMAAGERRAVMLGGEPGIGKTRLASELGQVLRAEGALVLAGRCDEDLGVPYQPFVEALRHYVDHASHLRLGRHAGELARLVPELAGHVPGLPEPLSADPETERYRLFDAVAGWLVEASAETPVLLVLDDLHWAAKPTVLLLRHVLRSPEPMRVLVVGTYRDTDIGRADPLTDFLGDLHRLGGAERLSLSGLDGAGVAAFIEQAAGHQLDEEGEALVAAVWRETEGNPFFTTEVIRHLAESGVVEQREDRWVVTREPEDFGIPEGVRDVVGRRLARLSDEENQVLACSAVIGLEFEPRIVQAAGGFTEGTVITALERAVATRLVVEVPGAVPRNRFAHALVRATLYDELTAARRVSLHRRVAEAIESVHGALLDDHLPALAHHWGRATGHAEAGGRAVEYATRAGDRALGQLAHDEAAVYYRQALEILDLAGGGQETQRLELLISRGEAERRAGDATHRQTLLDAARLAERLGDADALARAALANTRGFWGSIGQVDHERVGAMQAALAVLGSEQPATRARILVILAGELVYGPDPGEFRRLADAALALAREIDDVATLAEVLLSRGTALLGADTVRERLAETEELLRLTDQLGDPLTTCRAEFVRLLVALEMGLSREAERCREAGSRLADELGQPFLRWLFLMERVNVALLRGEFEDAERFVYETLAAGEAADQPDARIFFGSQLGHLRLEQGRLAELAEGIETAAAMAPAMPAWQAHMALLHCETGREDEARNALAGICDVSERFPHEGSWTRGLGLAAMVAANVGDEVSAGRIYAMFAPYAGQAAASGVLFFGAVDHYLGLLAGVMGRFDEAEAHFAAAERFHDDMGARPWLARTRLEWGRLLQRRGEASRARRLLQQALASATELGQGSVEAAAQNALQN